ncbi:MAG: MarR family winged helix-turn-helix transcriptional regulator [Bacteroidota bacterium]|jgi:DNA-binding MarR family transcriptional regulator
MTNNHVSRSQLVDLLNELNGILMVHTIGDLMEYLQDQDISPPRFMALQILEHHPGITITTLAQQLKLTLGSASQLIDRLENDGLVIRQEASNDRRIRRIILLEKGKNILSAVRNMTSVKLDQQLSTVPNEDIQSLYTAITNVLPYLIKDVK